MKDVKDQLVLITGSTDGLGKGSARALAAKGAIVMLHGRNRDRLDRTAKEIAQETGNKKIEVYLADLSSLAEVRGLAAEVQRNHDHLDLLINNAGIGFGAPGAKRALSRDAYELRFAVNYLAPFLLTNLLVPMLQRSSPARIVNVASMGQEAIDFGDIMLTKGYSGVRAYRRSKTALVMFTFDLAERLRKDDVTVNCLHPATYMDTNMVREAGIKALSSVQTGIDALMYVATSAEMDGVTGRFYDRKEEARAIPQAYDQGARKELLRISEELTSVELPS
ncbi:MAG: SDR family oxidoreductase [Methanomassiliicoccales archaeon]|nr:SDR family oxidoreductase [Methanomassiliicoccales archaeon]